MTIIVAGGAGADGKTTVLELVAKHLAAAGQRPLAIDANPDQTLLPFFGVAPHDAPAQICNDFPFLQNTLEGKNPDYPQIAHVVDTSPVTPHSVRWQPVDADPVMQRFVLEKDGVRLMHTGTYEARDLGQGCLHDKIGPLVFMLQRLNDGARGENATVLIDNAHGRDAFGTPLYAQGDAILVVARPDAKSAAILRDYLSMAREVERQIGHPVTVMVVGNRLSSDPAERREEEKFLRAIAGKSYIGGLAEDPALKRKFTNEGPRLDQLLPENARTVAHIADTLQTAARNPQRRKDWLDLCHGKATHHDKLTAPGISEQKSDYVPDADDHDRDQGHHHGPHCGHKHHKHGPGCKHD